MVNIESPKYSIGIGDKEFPYTIRFHDQHHLYLNIHHYSEWCKQSLSGRYFMTTSWIWFEHETDRNWFILRWS